MKHNREMNVSTEQELLKSLIKESVSELMDQKRDFFKDILGEVIEDKQLLALIKDGESTEGVSREEVFEALKNAD